MAARVAHNHKVTGSNPVPATKIQTKQKQPANHGGFFVWFGRTRASLGYAALHPTTPGSAKQVSKISAKPRFWMVKMREFSVRKDEQGLVKRAIFWLASIVARVAQLVRAKES